MILLRRKPSWCFPIRTPLISSGGIRLNPFGSLQRSTMSGQPSTGGMDVRFPSRTSLPLSVMSINPTGLGQNPKRIPSKPWRRFWTTFKETNGNWDLFTMKQLMRQVSQEKQGTHKTVNSFLYLILVFPGLSVIFSVCFVTINISVTICYFSLWLFFNFRCLSFLFTALELHFVKSVFRECHTVFTSLFVFHKWLWPSFINNSSKNHASLTSFMFSDNFHLKNYFATSTLMFLLFTCNPCLFITNRTCLGNRINGASRGHERLWWNLD